MKDQYVSIADNSKGEFKDKGSKFIAYAFPMKDEHELSEFLQSVKNDHPKARHYCFAYRLGVDDYNYRTNDDGEPSGSAGKPILGAIHSAGLSDVLVIVVRYFGGTKLGIPGLINAYKTAAHEALAAAIKKEIFITRRCRLHFDYSHMGKIIDVIKHQGIDIVHKELTATPFLDIEIRESVFDHKIAAIKASLLGWQVEDIDEKTSIPYCTFEP